MKLYMDLLNNQEILSDSFVDKETDLLYVAVGKWKIPEGCEEEDPATCPKVIDVVEKFCYDELDKSEFKKKSFVTAMKNILKAAKKNLKKQGKSEEEIAQWMKDVSAFVDKCVKDDWEDLQFYMNQNDYDYENAYIVIQKGMEFYYIKAAFKVEKC